MVRERLNYVTEFTEQDVRKILLGPYIKEQVSHCEGDVIPYCGFDLPLFLQLPLRRAYDDESISSVQWGERSDFIYIGSRWFKLKGDNPMDKTLAELCPDDPIDCFSMPDWALECPEGSMTEKCAKRELEVSDIVARKMHEYGFNAPHSPAGLIRYDVEFTGEKAYAAILQTFGETRLSQNPPGACDRDWRCIFKLLNETKTGLGESFLQSIMGWVGFANKLFKEAGLSLDKESLGSRNTTFYRIGDDYSIFPIDHEYTMIRTAPKRRGISYDMWRLDWILRVTDVMSKGHYKDIFYKAFDGQRIPEPIDRRVVELALS